ncbi:MAG: hypothetical protein CVV49_17630 [Spirochaetae bacterium HGW-Spirochaetae-5]|nr:MAG: hypothetical protein CVV49_17630 [Spirochaetae bacterium HGW-Spirochaetae-5]
MKTKLFFISMIITAAIIPISAQGINTETRDIKAAGYAVDLFPTVLSSIDKEPGYSFQAWAGFDQIKIRIVAAHLYQPDRLIDDDFKNYEMNVTAFIIDYFFRNDLTGFWIGTGAELWNCSIENKSSGKTAEWTDNILTAGAGYVWKITENVYLDPFAAVHYRMNDGKVTTGGEEFKRQRISASASIKIGYMLNL